MLDESKTIIVITESFDSFMFYLNVPNISDEWTNSECNPKHFFSNLPFIYWDKFLMTTADSAYSVCLLGLLPWGPPWSGWLGDPVLQPWLRRGRRPALIWAVPGGDGICGHWWAGSLLLMLGGGAMRAVCCCVWHYVCIDLIIDLLCKALCAAFCIKSVI